MNKIWVTEMKSDSWHPISEAHITRDDARQSVKGARRIHSHLQFRAERYVSEREIFEALGELLDLAMNLPSHKEYTKGLMFAAQSIGARLKDAK